MALLDPLRHAYLVENEYLLIARLASFNFSPIRVWLKSCWFDRRAVLLAPDWCCDRLLAICMGNYIQLLTLRRCAQLLL